jgi:hypothetical protein
LRIIASLGSLVSTLRSLASDETSNPEAAAEFADYVIEGLDRSVSARDHIDPRRVVDVQFAEFTADPWATIRTVYDRLGLELEPAAEARMRAFLAADRGVNHRYTFGETGLDAGELRERTRRYQEYFDVPSEPLP